LSNFQPLGAKLEPKKVTQPEALKETHMHIAKRRLGIYIGAAGIIGAALVFALVTLFSSFGSDRTANALLGETELSQEELFQLVKDNQLTAFWAGPQEGAKFSLTVTADKQVFIKYLPEGKGLSDTNPNYRIIATYPEPAAFDITRAAGTQSNAVAFVNNDGAAVYYDKSKANNVYLAYSGINYSIEIFDPDAEAALTLATLPGNISKIE